MTDLAGQPSVHDIYVASSILLLEMGGLPHLLSLSLLKNSASHSPWSPPPALHFSLTLIPSDNAWI